MEKIMLFVADFPNLSPYCGNLLIPVEHIHQLGLLKTLLQAETA
jgi:hypothetical protein